jgi:putative spermidine/putrescine transport system substrate-binding protein
MNTMKKYLIIMIATLFSFTPGNAVTLTTWGGAWTEAQIPAYITGAEQELGLEVNLVDYSGGLAEIKAQVESGNIQWDVIDALSNDTVVGCDEGLFLKVNIDEILPPAPDGTPASKEFSLPMPNKCAFPNVLYTWNYAYKDTMFPGDKPTTIQDFFDTKKFPGRRSIHRGAMTNLEMALVADGVSTDKVYDVLGTKKGVKRALKKIQKLCNDPKGGCVFWSAGAQAPEFVMSEEVVMGTGYNGRFFNAAVGEGAPITQVYDGMAFDYVFFVIVKESPRIDEAKKLLSYITSPQSGANMSKYLAYSPFRKSSMDIIEKNEPWYKDGKTNIMPHLPTNPANLTNYYALDLNFWADNGTDLEEAWENMKIRIK